MLRPRFYLDQRLAAQTQLTLDDRVARHVAKALRMKAGDTLYLFDGRGTEACATIAAVERNRVEVMIDSSESVSRESGLTITLLISMSRGDRMDTIVQKATELGVTRILPVSSERTELRLKGERAEKKLTHWRNVAISACEQCGRNTLPELELPQDLDSALGEASRWESALKLILHPAQTNPPVPDSCAELVLLVGPEGGFSDAEVDRAAASGFQPFSLGPRVLRTETAPLAAIALAQARWGDLLG